jgi:peptidoglycan/LPS O-acetylase OafA/YrhL
MKMFIRVLQVLLALWVIIGSVYMMGNYAFIASFWAVNTLPTAFWILLGVVQIVLAIGLLVSVKDGVLSKYATLSAIGLSIIMLAGIFLYSTYTGLGMLWAIVPAVLLAFVAYKRRPQANASQTKPPENTL